MGANFKLTDVTAATWKYLSEPPDGSAPPLQPSALCLSNVATCKKETADRINNKAFYARNKDWDPQPLPSITTPISWPFLEQPIFRTASAGKRDILNLAFVPAPPAGYSVKIYSVTYAAGANLPPEFIAVAYPRDIDIEKPPPFLVHFKHVPGQGITTWFKHFNPLGHDWMHFDAWNYFVFNAQSVSRRNIVDMPFLSSQQYSFGFTYQLRQAKKGYVLVIPHVSRVFDARGNLANYQIYSAALLREILINIQQDILSIKDKELSHVAISSNSSGCNVLSAFLLQNVATAKTDKAVEVFMRDEFKELFVLDPPEGFGDGMIKMMAGWLALTGNRSGFKGKCVRFYTHDFAKSMTQLTGTKAHPFTRGKNGFWESSAKTISLAYLPFNQNGHDIWTDTYLESQPNGRMPVNNFGFVHHVIPALFLKDAVERSLYV